MLRNAMILQAVLFAMSAALVFSPSHAYAIGESSEPKLSVGEDVIEKAISEIPNDRASKFTALIQETLRSGDEKTKKLVFKIVEKHLTDDPNQRIRYWCAAMISGFGKDGVKPLVRALQRDPDVSVRECAARGLGRCGGQEEISELLKTVEKDRGLTVEGRSVARAAVHAIAEIGGEETGKLFRKMWDTEQRTQERDKLVYRTGPARKIVGRLWPRDDRYSGLTYDLLGAMGTAGSPANLGLMEELLADPKDGYDTYALIAMREIAAHNRGKPEIVGRVRKTLHKNLNNANQHVVEHVVISFGEIGTADDIELLTPLLQDNRKHTGERYVGGKLSQEPYYPVRECAARAIELIKKREAERIRGANQEKKSGESNN